MNVIPRQVSSLSPSLPLFSLPPSLSLSFKSCLWNKDLNKILFIVYMKWDSTFWLCIQCCSIFNIYTEKETGATIQFKKWSTLGTPSSRYGILKSHHVHISWLHKFISKLLSIKFWERERERSHPEICKYVIRHFYTFYHLCDISGVSK